MPIANEEEDPLNVNVNENSNMNFERELRIFTNGFTNAIPPIIRENNLLLDRSRTKNNYKCKCGICGKVMNSSDELKLHVSVDHKVRSTRIDYDSPVNESSIDYTSEVHVCYHCNRIFQSLYLLNRHNAETCRIN